MGVVVFKIITGIVFLGISVSAQMGEWSPVVVRPRWDAGRVVGDARVVRRPDLVDAGMLVAEKYRSGRDDVHARLYGAQLSYHPDGRVPHVGDPTRIAVIPSVYDPLNCVNGPPVPHSGRHDAGHRTDRKGYG